MVQNETANHGYMARSMRYEMCNIQPEIFHSHVSYTVFMISNESAKRDMPALLYAHHDQCFSNAAQACGPAFAPPQVMRQIVSRKQCGRAGLGLHASIQIYIYIYIHAQAIQ